MERMKKERTEKKVKTGREEKVDERAGHIKIRACTHTTIFVGHTLLKMI